MRVLVTSIHRGAGYAIAKSLKPHCSWLTATISYRRPSFTFSRLFDRTLQLPPAKDHWINEEEHTLSRQYALAIAHFCKKEKIDAVWPSNDVDLFVLSRHRKAFPTTTKIMAPEYQILKGCADKYTLIEAALKSNFPVAASNLCHSTYEVESVLPKSTFPLVVKGRWSTNSNNVFVVENKQDALIQARIILEQQGSVILQDYIPSNHERSIHYIIDDNHNILKSFTLTKLRHLAPSYSTAIEVVSSPIKEKIGLALIRELKLSGFCVIQTRYDTKDRQYKIIEINSRFGSNSRILFSLGQDIVLYSTKLQLGALKDICTNNSEEYQSFPMIGQRGGSPIEDFLSIWSLFIAKMDKQKRADLPRVFSYLLSIFRFYLKRPTIDLHTKSILDDPLATVPYFICLLRYLLPTDKRIKSIKLIPWKKEEL